MNDVEFLTNRPIDPPAIIARVSAADRGGIATFIGLVRDHHQGRQVTGLDYSAYAAMAEAECGRIVDEASTRWNAAIALQHRVGSLNIGDVAVVVAAGSAHRDAAFDACRYVIEEVKRRVPIWKRERYVDGTEVWVDPTAATNPAVMQPASMP